MSSQMGYVEFAEKLKNNADAFVDFIRSIEETDTDFAEELRDMNGELEFQHWISEFSNWMENGAPTPFIYSQSETDMFYNEDPFGMKRISER